VTVPRPLRIGITGPIGCGKSTIALALAGRGAVVVDADALARQVAEPGEPAFAAVVARFGERFVRPDGSLDRAALGRLVFDDPRELADLEAIVHPAVRERAERAFARAAADGAPVVVVEAIRLVEGGLAGSCDEVWLVECPPEAQLARLVDRGMAPADAAQRIAAQEGLADRTRPVATRVIETAGSREAMEAAADAALDAALDAARARAVANAGQIGD
jgi:dephospho-CoA kinase